jgi:hypothetical protein
MSLRISLYETAKWQERYGKRGKYGKGIAQKGKSFPFVKRISTAMKITI